MKRQGEITFDTVVSEDDDHVEGCYRLVDEDWRVYYFSHSLNGKLCEGDPDVAHIIWPSGVAGIDGQFPIQFRLNKESIKKILSEQMGGNIELLEVRGPNSLQLK